ncbi:MAG TPA: hypothetical protein VK778_14590 [Solirubrobacteraceae bacterium]|nr:hypothetical protein [Solirubrobacteraceae bacterium]
MEGKLSPEVVLTEDLEKGAVTSEKIAAHTIESSEIAAEAVTANQMEKETITESRLADSLKKLIPLAVGRSGEMVLGKITIASAAVTAAGPIIVSAEGGAALGVSVTARKVGESFTVEATSPVSDDRVDWAVYGE